MNMPVYSLPPSPPLKTDRGLDALVYSIDEATEDMRIAYPMDLFDRNMTDGRMMMVYLDAGHWQQPAHGRYRARQDSRHLFSGVRQPQMVSLRAPGGLRLYGNHADFSLWA
jgi:hypothetical protein